MYRQVSESRVVWSMLVTLNSNLVVFQSGLNLSFVFQFCETKKTEVSWPRSSFSQSLIRAWNTSLDGPLHFYLKAGNKMELTESKTKILLRAQSIGDKSHIIAKSRFNSFFLIHRSWAPIKRFTVSESKAAKSVALWRLNEFMSNRFMLLWELNFKTKPDFSKMH